MRILKTIGRYLLNVLIGIDVFGSTLTGGNPNETISYRIGRMKLKHDGLIPWSRPVMKLIDWGLDRVDSNHSVDAYFNDILHCRGGSRARATANKPAVKK